MTRNVIAALAATAISAALISAVGAVEILKREPTPGKLLLGEHVYVDDGSCPKGKVKLVIGGAGLPYTGHKVVTSGSGVGLRRKIARVRKCVARPTR